ncbi:hypothetical protein CLOSCI_03647 [[Clostridium] scindens ATCC 35704]|nr:hypothetical protein CLOSCI_03647 [[Clostridium] scindens ATCC 35704]
MHSLSSVTGRPASAYAIIQGSAEELQGELGDYACCLAPSGSSL